MALPNYQSITDCRSIICSGELSFEQAAAMFREFQAKHSKTDIHLLDYAMEHAPLALPFVLRILGEFGDMSRLLDKLVDAYDSSVDGRMRARLASLIAPNLRSMQWATQAMADPNARLRANVIEGIRAWNTDTELLVRALQDPNHRVVCNACISLDELGDPRGRQNLTALLTSDARSEFRVAACWALGRIATTADVPVLGHFAHDANPGVRVHARRALRRPDLCMLSDALGASFKPAAASQPVPSLHR